jgi:hypothetical protein
MGISSYTKNVKTVRYTAPNEKQQAPVVLKVAETFGLVEVKTVMLSCTKSRQCTPVPARLT